MFCGDRKKSASFISPPNSRTASRLPSHSKVFIRSKMETNKPLTNKATKQRKNAMLVLPKLENFRSEAGNETGGDEVVRVRTRSLHTPPTWHGDRREAERSPTMSSANNNINNRKYSDNLHLKRNKSETIGAKSKQLLNQRGSGRHGRRTKSLVHNDRQEITIEKDALLRHRGYMDGSRPFSAAPFVGGGILDEMTWSRYWHYARNRSNGRDFSFSGGNDKYSSDELRFEPSDLDEHDIRSRNCDENGPRGDTCIPLKELSLEERLEKIEQERGLAPRHRGRVKSS